MKNVNQLLEEAGGSHSYIVKMTTYIISPGCREPVSQQVGKWLNGLFVCVLDQPQWLMEIDVIAVIPDNWKSAQR